MTAQDVTAEDNARLSLGGIARTATDASVPLQAATFTHPALPGRSLVRLVAEPLTEAERLALEVHGFQLTSQIGVGHVRRRAIGFPAWPIIHDPANAHHALNLVGDLERLTPLARSKPKLAKERIDELAALLDASAPHFLPTFLEEAGRLFLRQDNAKMAATMFGQAREFERRHGLSIDPERHAEAFLEFAYAGAITVKELSNEARALADRSDAEGAYEGFLHLCVERSGGGLPPYTGMAKDLRRLAKAAGRRAPVEDRRVVRRFLNTPAIERAPEAFWSAYAPALAAECAGPDGGSVRTRLLGLTPELPTATWLDVLERAGAFEDLETSPQWLQRMADMLAARRGSDPRLRALARRVTPAVVAAGTPVEVAPFLSDLDLLDELLAAGVALHVRPTARLALDVQGWAKAAEETPEHARDLLHIAHDETLGRLLDASVRANAAAAPQRLLDTPGTRPAVVTHLQEALARLSDRVGVVDLQAAVTVYAPFTVVNDREVQQLIDTLRERCQAEDVLADNLQLGVWDELAWPAYESVRERLDARASTGRWSTVASETSWPALVLWVDREAYAVDGTEVRPLDLSWTTQPPRCVRLVGARTGVAWLGGQGWDDRHHDSLEGAGWPGRLTGVSLEVPAGRLQAGGLQRLGEALVSGGGSVWHDGRHHWSAQGQTVVEIDSETGEPGRASLPNVFAELVSRHQPQGWTLAPAACQLMPVTTSTAGSWSSSADGFHRLAVFARGQSGEREWLVVDAVGQEFRGSGGRLPCAALARPGGGTWLVIGRELVDPLTGQHLFTGDRSGISHLEPALLHHLRPRDPRASARLRAVTPRGVRALVEASRAFAAVRHRPDSDDAWRTLAREAAKVTGSNHAPLIGAIADLALDVIMTIGRLQAKPASPRQRPPEVLNIHDEALSQAAGHRLNLQDSLLMDAAATLTAGAPPKWVGYAPGWSLFVGRPAALLAAAAAPGRDVAEIDAWRCLHRALAPLHDASVTRMETAVTELPARSVQLTGRQPTLVRADGQTGAVRQGSQVVPVASIQQPAGTRTNIGPALDAVRARVAAEGPRAFDPDRARRLADACGLTYAEACLVLAACSGTGWAKNFLPKELRQQMGVKVDEANAAKERLKELDWPAMLAISVGDDPMAFLERGPDVDALAAHLCDRLGQVALPHDVRQLVAAASIAPDDLACLLDGTLAAHLESVPGSATRSRHVTVGRVVAALMWAAESLPRDHAIRGALAAGADALVHHLQGGTWDLGLDHAWREVFGDRPGAEGEPPTFVGGLRHTSHGRYGTVEYLPARGDASDVAVLAQSPLHTAQALALLMSGRLTNLADDLRTPGTGAGRDPRACVPDLVDEVARAEGVSTDAAAYHLQLLTLAEPTDRAVRDATGWTTAELAELGQELLAKGLVVEGKRARAGRAYFLPGGWQEAEDALPLESWKLAAWGYRVPDGTTKARAPFQVARAIAPLPQLFRDAWRRVSEGDGPGYGELTTTRRRR